MFNREAAERCCARKICYRESHARALEARSKYYLRAYKCPVCFGWHTTHMANGRTAKVYAA